jgi:hypothetical protein
MVPAGKYLLKASRRGFLSAEYGQKRWNSAGTPFEATDNDTPYLTIRLPRFSGITGTVVDENDVGIPGGEVAAYKLAQPPELVTRARADDRGVYRLPGLEPGRYLVRSAPFEDDGVFYVPTFARQVNRAAESRPVDVTLDRDAAYVDVMPAQGRLFTLSGAVSPPTLPGIRVTLVSDMGRHVSQGSVFRFGALAPGDYEIFAETTEGQPYAAYRSLPGVSKETGVALEMLPVQATQVLVTPTPAGGVPALRLAARRKDLAGRGNIEFFQLANGRAMLTPGRWELLLIPPAGSYVSAFQGNTRQDPRTRPDGWSEFTAGSSSTMRFTLSGSMASMRGVVKSAGATVAGAPVILEAFDPIGRVRQLDLITTRTDADGRYAFESLPPGDYRILATFEYLAPSPEEMEAAGAASIHLAQGDGMQRDLDLYVIR